jgi:hypothetical protein
MQFLPLLSRHFRACGLAGCCCDLFLLDWNLTLFTKVTTH